MVTVNPIRRALVPVDPGAAQRLCSPNYDEFQSDREIWDLLQVQPESVLRVTMPHCNAPHADEMLGDGSPEALAIGAEKMAQLVASSSTRVIESALFLYEIVDPARPGVRQIGLGGMAPTDDIRTEATPDGVIIRNEGIREEKARGRADLIEATSAIIGTVNLSVDDATGKLLNALQDYADGRACDFEAIDKEDSSAHRIWIVTAADEIASLRGSLAAEPHAYVADGNHRSAAAAMRGTGEFLTVFFPAHTMGLAPYNRLVAAPGITRAHLEKALRESFEIESLDLPEYQPDEVHEIGLYLEGAWLKLVPRDSAFDDSNAAQSIDSDIVQRHLFAGVLGIEDPRAKELTFVGGNRDAAYLRAEVDAGRHDLAVTLAPVTIDQFIEVCRQNRIMPPKSTWFQPKIRSGLVMALLG
ncbi:MAG: DUF1015 family protein [Roseibacillus sp.]|nr:DUF1015 family protein [Roseibacillus sp.]